jgi:hypothetical protein
MRVAGVRQDGALWLILDGGLAVILRGDTCSPAVDPHDAERLGPWQDAHGVSGADRRELARRLDRAATRTLEYFALDRKVRVSATQGKKKMSFEYTVTGEEEDDAVGLEPGGEDSAEAPTAPAEEPTAPAEKAETDDEDPAHKAVVAKK